MGAVAEETTYDEQHTREDDDDAFPHEPFTIRLEGKGDRTPNE
jgi:hypothetical protein